MVGCSAPAQRRPNIIVILSDDQGWNATSVEMIEGQENTRSDFFRTPNIERLARGGMVFSNGYAPASICSPSRHSIQFGISPARLHKTRNDDFFEPETFETAAIPQVLKSIEPNYSAAHFGKWHVWNSPESLGYDYSDGKTTNHTGRVFSWSQLEFQAHADPKFMFEVTKRSIEFMEKAVQEGKPFYLQISHYAIHLGVEARPNTLERYRTMTPGQIHTAYWYAAMIEDMDATIGTVLDRIEDLGIADETFVFFTSDNGGLAHEFESMNYPLRGGKHSFFEGGLRVPFIVTGPGIEPGSRSDVPVIGWDLLPTFADLAGRGPLPERVEGGSIRSLLENRGRGEVKRPQPSLLFFLDGIKRKKAVIRVGDFKLKREFVEGTSELYDLSRDLSERVDLAATRTAVVEDLERQLQARLNAIKAERENDLRSRNAKM